MAILPAGNGSGGRCGKWDCRRFIGDRKAMLRARRPPECPCPGAKVFGKMGVLCRRKKQTRWPIHHGDEVEEAPSHRDVGMSAHQIRPVLLLGMRDSRLLSTFRSGGAFTTGDVGLSRAGLFGAKACSTDRPIGRMEVPRGAPEPPCDLGGGLSALV